MTEHLRDENAALPQISLQSITRQRGLQLVDQSQAHTMALLIGVLLAIAVGLFATATRLDRDRAFYPTVMIVIALLYSLFAVMGESIDALVIELLVGTVFIAVATFGFKSSLWFVVAALAAHGVFDLVHGRFISNPGVPSWWPAFCLTYDVTAAAYLAWLIRSGHTRDVE